MSFMDIMFSFNGRIRRSQYWQAAIGLNVGYLVVMMFVFALIGIFSRDMPTSPVIYIVQLLSFVPYIWAGLAIAAKRWHDRGKSGFMVLVIFIPIVGILLTLMECGILDGTQGPNKYGPSPKGIDTISETVF